MRDVQQLDDFRIVKYFARADSVYAIGRFNNYSTTATPLTETAEGVWELRLPPETDVEHLSLFVIPEGVVSGRVVSRVDDLFAP